MIALPGSEFVIRVTRVNDNCYAAEIPGTPVIAEDSTLEATLLQIVEALKRCEQQAQASSES